MEESIGYKKPPIQTRFAAGQSGNPNGRPKGSPNRSTIARMALKMQGQIPDAVFDKMKAIYPALQKKGSIEFIATIQQASKAILDMDTAAYKALMDSAYGAPVPTIDMSADVIVEYTDENTD